MRAGCKYSTIGLYLRLGQELELEHPKPLLAFVQFHLPIFVEEINSFTFTNVWTSCDDRSLCHPYTLTKQDKGVPTPLADETICQALDNCYESELAWRHGIVTISSCTSSPNNFSKYLLLMWFPGDRNPPRERIVAQYVWWAGRETSWSPVCESPSQRIAWFTPQAFDLWVKNCIRRRTLMEKFPCFKA